MKKKTIIILSLAFLLLIIFVPLLPTIGSSLLRSTSPVTQMVHRIPPGISVFAFIGIFLLGCLLAVYKIEGNWSQIILSVKANKTENFVLYFIFFVFGFVFKAITNIKINLVFLEIIVTALVTTGIYVFFVNKQNKSKEN